jgi:hypothetical protein
MLNPFFLRFRQSRGRKDFDPAIFVFIAERTGLHVGRGTKEHARQGDKKQGGNA